MGLEAVKALMGRSVREEVDRSATLLDALSVYDNSFNGNGMEVDYTTEAKAKVMEAMCKSMRGTILDMRGMSDADQHHLARAMDALTEMRKELEAFLVKQVER